MHPPSLCVEEEKIMIRSHFRFIRFHIGSTYDHRSRLGKVCGTSVLLCVELSTLFNRLTVAFRQ